MKLSCESVEIADFSTPKGEFEKPELSAFVVAGFKHYAG
jgi:hypothetical protein